MATTQSAGLGTSDTRITGVENAASRVVTCPSLSLGTSDCATNHFLHHKGVDKHGLSLNRENAMKVVTSVACYVREVCVMSGSGLMMECWVVCSRREKGKRPQSVLMLPESWAWRARLHTGSFIGSRSSPALLNTTTRT